ncbi:MAG: cytidylate kinase-like family protein [Planctomycetales bacterium]|nr:cytidylate kinase-like family protein [Planctomycetales bacterium]
MHTTATGLGATSQVAEKRMRQWAQGLETQRRLDEVSNSPVDVWKRIHPFVAISREEGAGGAELAKRVCERLDWQHMDRELLIYMAEAQHVPKAVLDAVDEKTSNWLLETLGKWLNHHVVTQQEYVVHLGEIVLLAVQHQPSVFVGRGAQFLLPRGRGLSVQLVAPMEMRLAEIERRHGLARAAAERHLAESDEGRHHFIDQYFHRDVRDPHHYDLVINREFVDLDTATDLICDLVARRFPSP